MKPFPCGHSTAPENIGIRLSRPYRARFCKECRRLRGHRRRKTIRVLDANGVVPFPCGHSTDPANVMHSRNGKYRNRHCRTCKRARQQRQAATRVRALRATCRHGHSFADAFVYTKRVLGAEVTFRKCRTCTLERSAARRATGLSEENLLRVDTSGTFCPRCHLRTSVPAGFVGSTKHVCPVTNLEGQGFGEHEYYLTRRRAA